MEPRISALLDGSLTGAADPDLFDQPSALHPTTAVSSHTFAPLIHTSYPSASLQYLTSPLGWDASDAAKAPSYGSLGPQLPTLLGDDRGLRVDPEYDRHPAEHEDHGGAKGIKSSAPLTEVLNKNTDQSPARNGVALSKILRRPSESAGAASAAGHHSPRKRKRDQASTQAQDFLTLPRPQPPARRNVKRQRIPPLLQGLHQPPPDAGLFPPITAEAFKAKGSDGLRQGLKAQSRAERGTRDSAASQAAAPSYPDIEKEPKRSQDDRPKTSPAKDQTSAGKAAQKTTEPGSTKAARKRKKWTEKETADLLQGVAQFGIGRWKQILADPSYKFDGRTPVDLKDRFRTCCPEEYRRLSSSAKQAKGKCADGQAGRGRGAPSHRKTASDLAELGISGPFRKSDRRERREFSAAEDQALLTGFEKHGAFWKLIRKESGEVLAGRKPTDLRDRFRNAFPEKFEQAGYVLKSKKRDSTEAGEEPTKASGHNEAHDGPNEDASSRPDSPLPITPRRPTVPPSTTASTTAATSAPATSLKPLHLSLMNTFDWLGEEIGFASDDEGSSPIRLDRSIFDWANIHNPSTMSTSAPQQQTSGLARTSNPRSSGPTGAMKTALPSMVTLDEDHVNPLDTVNLVPQRTVLPSSYTLAASASNGPLNSGLGPNDGTSLAPIASQMSTGNLPSISLPPGHSTLSANRRNVTALNLPRPSDLF